jgi:hypothetical protein
MLTCCLRDLIRRVMYTNIKYYRMSEISSAIFLGLLAITLRNKIKVLDLFVRKLLEFKFLLRSVQ